MRVWVITREGTRHAKEVIGILSARKSSRTVKDHVEWLYALLHYHPHEHLELAKYTNPSNPYEAQYKKTNTSAPVKSVMTCGDNPFLMACRAKNVVLTDTDAEPPILKWTMPNWPVCDPQTLNIVERIPGAKCKAPTHLPLRVALPNIRPDIP